LQITQDFETALLDAGRRLSDAGWAEEEIEDTPFIRDAAAMLGCR
jgi:hypothetical protein